MPTTVDVAKHQLAQFRLILSAYEARWAINPNLRSPCRAGRASNDPPRRAFRPRSPRFRRSWERARTAQNPPQFRLEGVHSDNGTPRQLRESAYRFLKVVPVSPRMTLPLVVWTRSMERPRRALGTTPGIKSRTSFLGNWTGMTASKGGESERKGLLLHCNTMQELMPRASGGVSPQPRPFSRTMREPKCRSRYRSRPQTRPLPKARAPRPNHYWIWTGRSQDTLKRSANRPGWICPCSCREAAEARVRKLHRCWATTMS